MWNILEWPKYFVKVIKKIKTGNKRKINLSSSFFE